MATKNKKKTQKSTPVNLTEAVAGTDQKPVHPAFGEPEVMIYRCPEHKRAGCGPCLLEWEAKNKAEISLLRTYAVQLETYVRGLVPVVPVVTFVPVR
jgi:hypothetical protein